ncbi:flagellar hook-length control protein FliK [Gammaproteobacteria bacterium]|nr:flagellar hook-length control protein FliK [Gammaproteobacteria bacterium]|tara:strand:- start:7302 stop:8543 length:1242 start_codon:yes stop_codon:yes gene_type:complete
MLEFENIFTAKSTSPNASKLEGSAQKPDNKEVSEGAFQTLLEDSKNSDIPAKIGNIPPVEFAAKSEKKLRDLDGGSQLVLSGAEPTDDSITAFAVLQGIDPDVIALIVGGKIQPETSGLEPIKVPKLPSGQPPLETGHAVASDKALTLDLLSKNSYKLDFNSDESDLSRTPLKSVEPTSNMEHKNGINLQVKNLASGVQKLAAIDLGVDAKEILSLAYDRRLTNRSAGTVSVPRTENQTHLVASYAPELRVDLTAKSLAESQPSPDQELIVRRQEQYMEVSRRLTEALGERLTAQITKGAWRVEMDLHPKSLGRIEINLEMKNGSLEAYFNPSQNITRELLQESFDKLKDVFAEHGIDSAYVGLGDGKNKDSDGNPTDEEFLAKTDKEAEVGSSLERVDRSNRLSLDGLDVQV